MRKLGRNLSILVALCVMVTVGGVYATWSYSQESTNEITDFLTANMQDYIGASASGHIEVLEKSIDIRVTDNVKEGATVGEQAGGDGEAEIEIAGHIIVLFTPFDNATSDVKASGISLKYTVGQTGSMTYDGKPIFTVDTQAQDCVAMTKISAETLGALNAKLGADKQLDSSDYGKFYVEISGVALESLIGINGTITLDTLIEYHTFQEALGGGNFQIVISEK